MKKYTDKRLTTFRIEDTDIFVKEIQLDIDQGFHKVGHLVEKFKPFVSLYIKNSDKAHVYIHLKPFTTWSLIKDSLSTYDCSSKLYFKAVKILCTSRQLNPQLALLNEIVYSAVYRKLVQMFNADPIFASNHQQGICQTWESKYYTCMFEANDEIDLYELAQMVLDKEDMIDIITEFFVRLDDVIFNKHYNPLMRFRRTKKVKYMLTVTIEDLKLILQKLIETGIYQHGNRQPIWMCLNGIGYKYITKDKNERLKLFEEHLYPLIRGIDEEHYKRLDVVKCDNAKKRLGFPSLIEIIRKTKPEIKLNQIFGHLNYVNADVQQEVTYRRKSFKESHRRTSFYDTIGVIGMFLIDLWLKQKSCKIDVDGKVTFEIKSSEFKKIYKQILNKQLPNLNYINKVLDFLMKKKVIINYKTVGYSKDKRYIIISHIENLSTAKSLISLDPQTQLPIIFMRKDSDIFETYNNHKQQMSHPHRQSLVQLIIAYYNLIVDELSIFDIFSAIKQLQIVQNDTIIRKFHDFKFNFKRLTKTTKRIRNGLKWHHLITAKSIIKDLLQYRFMKTLPSSNKQLQKFINYIRYQMLDAIKTLSDTLMFQYDNQCNKLLNAA